MVDFIGKKNGFDQTWAVAGVIIAIDANMQKGAGAFPKKNEIGMLGFTSNRITFKRRKCYGFLLAKKRDYNIEFEDEHFLLLLQLLFLCLWAVA